MKSLVVFLGCLLFVHPSLAKFQSGFDQFKFRTKEGNEQCVKRLVEQTIMQTGIMKGVVCNLDSIVLGYAKMYKQQPYMSVTFQVVQSLPSGLSQTFEGTSRVAFKKLDNGFLECGFSEQGRFVLDKEGRESALASHESAAKESSLYALEPSFVSVFKLTKPNQKKSVHELFGYENVPHRSGNEETAFWSGVGNSDLGTYNRGLDTSSERSQVGYPPQGYPTYPSYYPGYPPQGGLGVPGGSSQ